MNSLCQPKKRCASSVSKETTACISSPAHSATKQGLLYPEPENKQFKQAHIQSIYASVPDVWLVGREMDRKHTLRMPYHMPNMILRPTIIRAVLRRKPPQSSTKYPSVEVTVEE